MKSQEWSRIKAIQPPAPRFFHVACRARMVQLHPNMPAIPQVDKGESYNVGRNKSKRLNRRSDICQRKAARRAA